MPICHTERPGEAGKGASGRRVMEGFDLIATGLWSIVPPILALVLALITKEVYSSLTVGVFTGMVKIGRASCRERV